MVSIPNELINQLGFVTLAVFSLYMLAVYGETLRRSQRRGLAATGYAVQVITNDVRIVIGAVTALAIGLFGWVFGFGNFGAALAGLSGWIAPVWFWFTSGALSGLNVAGITDFGIGDILITAGMFGFLAVVVRNISQRYRTAMGVSTGVLATLFMTLLWLKYVVGADIIGFIFGWSIGTFAVIVLVALFIIYLIRG